MFKSIYKNRKVLVTGHTGFKGSWLVYWLNKLGAEVCGCALKAPTTPNHFDLLQLAVRSEIVDIRDKYKLFKVFTSFKPEIVFHLAAQPLVRLSYEIPLETLETNIIGTANVFEACRHTSSVRAIVNITSDKCYENREWIWGYRENDPMGGYDPYSASKGCAELITSSYRNSFFNIKDYGRKHNILLASCRAGNVIGGGDWAGDRLMPDIMKAAAAGKTVGIRNPYAIRPWQHVLEPLCGYLLIGRKLFEGDVGFSEGWNFGHGYSNDITVKQVVKDIVKYWSKIKFNIDQDIERHHEAGLLKLDSSKALSRLKWCNVWDIEETLEKTISWYRDYYEYGKIKTKQDLNSYIEVAKEKKLEWSTS